MPRKNESPIEVILEKSPTGTWSVPKIPMRRLKPWQRLWFVTGIVYLILLAVSYHMLMPNQELLERKMVFSVTEEVKRYDGMAFAGESPQKIFETARSQGYAAWIAATRSRFRIGSEGTIGFDRVEQNYRDATSALPAKRKLGVMACFVAWLMPMSVLYAIGLVVDWIKRGARAVKRRRVHVDSVE
jgi:hypothetical protein